MLLHNAKFILKRIVHSVFVLLGLSMLVFFIARMVPTDIARSALGQQASEEAVEKLRDDMRLNDSMPVQYFYWLKGAVRGDLGFSVTTKRPVIVDLKEFLPATLELGLFSLLFSLVLGQLLGVLAARYQNTLVDHFSRLVAYSGTVTPSFIFGIMFMLLFSYWLHIFPTIGRLSPGVTPPGTITGFYIIDGLIAGQFHVVGNAIWHLILPAFSLALSAIAQESRITRASVVDNLRKSYVRTARANGIPESKVMFKYVLKPSLIPTVAVMGMDFACVLTNAFLVELVFFWPGFSRYGVTAMQDGDVFAISAVVLVLGTMFIVMNLLVDIVTSILDPRINLAERS